MLAEFLLAPRYFDDLARRAGGDATVQPLFVPDESAPGERVDIVLDRYAAASALLA